MNWQKLIEKLLNDHNVSPAEIEAKTGSITNQAIYDLKNGETKKPRRSTKRAIEEYFNIKIDDTNPQEITYENNPQITEQENKPGHSAKDSLNYDELNDIREVMKVFEIDNAKELYRRLVRSRTLQHIKNLLDSEEEDLNI